MESSKEKTNGLLIDRNETILHALKRMDLLNRKLLIVSENGKFIGLLSIGDIQRAIIRNISLETRIDNIIRRDILVSSSNDNIETIKEIMLKHRLECMPILDRSKNLVDVIFWEDIFSKDKVRISRKIDLPIVIMAGGKGLRLKPLTNILPKPLIPIGEKSIIENIMDRFVSVGCNRFLLSLNYKAEMIQYYLDSLNNPDYKIDYFKEDRPLGTAGSLYLIKDRINSTFFVSNCDILVEQDLIELYDYHLENKNDITIVAALKHYQIPYGTIETGVDGRLRSIDEKPEITFKINSGMYLLEPEVLAEIPENCFLHITELITKIKQKNGRIGVFPISENSWKDYGLLENLPYVVRL